MENESAVNNVHFFALASFVYLLKKGCKRFLVRCKNTYKQTGITCEINKVLLC